MHKYEMAQIVSRDGTWTADDSFVVRARQLLPWPCTGLGVFVMLSTHPFLLTAQYITIPRDGVSYFPIDCLFDTFE